MSDFEALFLADTPFIDVRAEVEFAGGSFPTAVNLPILTTEERHKVGTCYKQQGQQAAIELGHKLVSGEVRAGRTQGWCDYAGSHANTHVFCWRGGMRSNLAGEWMAQAGIDAPVVPGGYKALRRYLIDVTQSVAENTSLVVIGGRTGVGKTPLVNSLSTGIDLEAHANHRGSSFGRRVAGPPSQIDFEHRLAIDLLKTTRRQPGAVVFLEDESRRIGAVSMPLELHLAMAKAPLALLEMSLEQRVARVLQEYVIEQRQEHEAIDANAGFDNYRRHLLDALNRIKKRLGGVRYQHLKSVMTEAFELEQQGKLDLHRIWIERLLVDYYDPMYNYQLAKVQDRVVFKGDFKAVCDWAAQYQSALA